MTTKPSDHDRMRRVTTSSEEGVHVNCNECGVRSPAYASAIELYNNAGRHGWSRLGRNGKNVFRCPGCRSSLKTVRNLSWHARSID